MSHSVFTNTPVSLRMPSRQYHIIQSSQFPGVSDVTSCCTTRLVVSLLFPVNDNYVIERIEWLHTHSNLSLPELAWYLALYDPRRVDVFQYEDDASK